jgi:ABC-2 type transport system ATP-binding protein
MLDLIRPQQGQIEIMGLDPQRDPVAVQRRVGYLPGELNLEGNLRVERVLRDFSELRGNEVDWDHVRDLARRLELDLTVRVKNLSKGNRQKVGVIQALMHRPVLLLMDEPTSGLDPLMQQEVYRLLRQAQADGATLFFSSHIISEVETLAERVAIIRQGVIVEQAVPEQLRHMALRRLQVRFQEPVDLAALEALPAVRVVSQSNGISVTLQIEGELDPVVKALADYPVGDLETERPSLEEIFLTYYERQEG